GIQVVSEGDPGELSNDMAMPLALIINELMTNAVKHGLNGKDHGTIRVGMKRDGNRYVLSVEDEGPGFDLSAVRRRASGLRLVEGRAGQVGGTFEVHTDPVTRCSLTFAIGGNA